MMIPVRLYDKPRDFAEMMARHLHSVLGLVVRPLAEEPLLL